MLDSETKRRIDSARDILVGKVPDPKSQVEQITIALIYKFMYDMDSVSEELGGERSFFSGKYEHYGWNKLLSPQLSGLEMLNLYSEAIQQMNFNDKIPQLFRDIFKNAYLPYRDPETLKSFLKVINDFEYDHSERLGDAFEYLLSVLGSQGDAGQFRTPRQIIDFMVYLVDPKKGESILDPACGTAGFLISSYKHIVKTNSSNYKSEEDSFQFGNPDGLSYKGENLTNNDRKKLPLSFKGYDISPDMVRLSLVNLYLHGFVQPSIFEYDTLTSEDRWNEHADVILANPPFMSPKGGIRPHKKFSIQSNRSEVLFVDYIIEHLSPKGRAAVIVPEGIIFQSGKAYKSLRKMLVEKYLYAVISLPAGIFNPYSGVKTSILLIDKTISQSTDKILFAKVENDGFDLGAQRRANDRSELPRVAKAIRDYVESVKARSEFDVSSSPNLLIATKEKIAETGDYNLSGERYNSEIIRITKFNLCPISEIAKVESGFGFPLEKQGRLNEVYPFLKVSDMNLKGNEQYITSWNNSINDKDVIDLKLKIFPKFTIIFPKIGAAIATNKKRILSKPSTFDNNVMGIIIEENKVNYKFLYYILLSINISDWASKSSPPSMRKSTVENFKIPLPPIEVQREIVEEIEGYQKIIDGARQVIDNYKPQIQIDPSWEMVELGNVLKKENTTIEPINLSGEVNYIGLENISKQTGELVGISTTNFEEIKSTKFSFRKNTILYGKLRPNLNKVWLSNTEGICSTDIFVIDTINKKNDIRFFSTYLRTDKFNSEVLLGLKGAQLPRIDWNYFSSIKIPVPEFKIQKKIADAIEIEQKIIDANKELISIFEKKIKDKIASVWGEENLKQ